MRTSAMAILLLAALAAGTAAKESAPMNPNQPATGSVSDREVVTLGGGCFWCIEAVFLELKGVEKVESGYSGGTVADPNYREVCTGTTGHAETVQITFNPAVIPLKQILRVFFAVHDPTTLNRQGADVGTQYRSVIFYRGAGQKATAEGVMRQVEAEKLYSRPLVTQFVPFQAFYKAEGYHQDYYNLHGEEPYCSLVISPKMAKFRAKFSALRKAPAGQ